MIIAAGTIVVKIGSSSLAQPSGHLDPDKLDALTAALAQIRLMDGRVVLVSSDAIAAGFGPLNFDSRPVDVATQRTIVAVGRGLLVTRYETAFGRFGICVDQILITTEDTICATQYHNVERTPDRLLDLGVVSIINESDSLASSEIRLSDNDRLSALVISLVRAEALALLIDVGALHTVPPSQPDSRHVEYVPNVTGALSDIQASGSSSKIGTGGMVIKLEAACMAAVSGIPIVLTYISNTGPATMDGPVGTVLTPVKARDSPRRLWVGFIADPRGTIVVDVGADQTTRGGRVSLLAADALEVHDDFSAGDPVWIDTESGEHLTRDLAGFDSKEIPQMLGCNTARLKHFLGPQYTHPLVHRNDLVLV